ncbi:unnamed protein product [Oppiella nova]|uniref:Uncharacterized protein n=1 Tax=Oppiella nova TaxID=334625 RepID=A0A7R9MMT5_9ACAR|nr:unnamed protein product [Oppiella nova]CAG2179893.1 unnamed protein product [Oppiella nova]
MDAMDRHAVHMDVHTIRFLKITNNDGLGSDEDWMCSERDHKNDDTLDVNHWVLTVHQYEQLIF